MGATEEMVEEGVKKYQYSWWRFGLATGARKMIDNEYEHAVQSLETGIYVYHQWSRLLIGMNRKNHNVLD